MFFNREDRKALDKYIGEKYAEKYLKKWTIWIRKALMDKSKRTPDTYLIKTKSGKKYKLLISHNEGSHHIKNILNVHNKIKNLELAPKILLYGKRFLLIEWIEGNYPSFSEKEFVVGLAYKLATLHKYNSRFITKKEYIEDIKKEFENIKLLPNVNIDIIKLIELKITEKIPVGYTYGDHNVENYVWNNNDLKMIDLGSFVNDAVIDTHLAGGQFFYKIDINVFKKAYIESGGKKFLFDNLDILRLASTIRAASHNYIQCLNAPFWDWRLKDARKHNYNWAINEMNVIYKRLKNEN